MHKQDLLKLKKVALVGATDRPEKYGNIILRFLKTRSDYELFPVNPNLKTPKVMDLTVYPTLRDVPVKLDLVVAVVPPKVTSQVLQEAIELEIPYFWCQPGASTPEIEMLAQGTINLTRDECIMVALG